MSLRASNRAPSEEGGSDSKINWDRVEQAVNFLNELDIIEMATHIVTQAQVKGPKEAFNEAGSVRYQLAKARQQYQYLRETVCKDSLESQKEQIQTLIQANARKRVLTHEEAAATKDTDDGNANGDNDDSKDKDQDVEMA